MGSPVLLLLLLLQALALATHVCDVRKPPYSAAGDNATEDTSALQRAIDACAAQQREVVVPPGRYLIRPLQLRNHSVLTLSPGATLVAWPDRATWPNASASDKPCNIPGDGMPEQTYLPQQQSLLWASHATNITIRGAGSVDGQGWRWLGPLPGQSYSFWKMCRPRMVDIRNTTSVVLANFSILNAPCYNINAHAVTDLEVAHLTIDSGCGYHYGPNTSAPNTDGINIAGTRIHIHDCTVRNGDDCVPVNAPSRDVLVERLRCECGNGLVPIIWEGTSAGDPWDIRTHGGNITNVTFRDTTLSRTKLGITIKSLPMMTGTVQGITFENIVVDHVGTAILVDTMSQDNGGAGVAQLPADRRATVGLGVMQVQGITIRNLTGTARVAGKFDCTQGSCSEIALSGVRLPATATYSCVGNVTGTAAPGCVPTLPSCLRSDDATTPPPPL